MSDTPFFSIGIPVYNTSKYVKRCLDSIYAQDFENIEIIFVNDGSTDNSGRLLDEFAAADRRIKVIHRENFGLPAARNAAIYKATGKYIYFIDSDDTICDGVFKRAYEKLVENNYPDLLHTGFIRVNDGVETPVPVVYPGDEFFDPSLTKDERWFRIWLTRKSVNQVMTKFIKREFLEKHGISFSTRLFAQEDSDFSFNINRKADTMAYADIYAFKYYKNREDSLSTRWSYKALSSVFSRWAEFYKDIEFYKITDETRQRIIDFKPVILTDLRSSTLSYPAEHDKAECFKLIELVDYYFGKDIRKLPISTGVSAVEKAAFVIYKIFGIKTGFKLLYTPFYKYLKFRKVI